MANPASDIPTAGTRRGQGKWNGFRWWAREGRQAQPTQQPQSHGGATRAESAGQPHATRVADDSHVKGHSGGGRDGVYDSRCVTLSPWRELVGFFNL